MTTTTAIEAQGRNWRPVDTLGIRVKLTRMSLGISQQEAADAIGITAREWQSLEEGRAARRDETAMVAALATLDMAS